MDLIGPLRPNQKTRFTEVMMDQVLAAPVQMRSAKTCAVV